MKTLETLYAEILGDETKKAAFVKAAKENNLEAFLKEEGCQATPDDIKAFLKEKQSQKGELSDAELDSVAGGCNMGEAVLSVTTLGMYCAGMALTSAVAGDMKGDDGEILCDYKKYQ